MFDFVYYAVIGIISLILSNVLWFVSSPDFNDGKTWWVGLVQSAILFAIAADCLYEILGML